MCGPGAGPSGGSLLPLPPHMNLPPLPPLAERIRMALAEDLGADGDITTDAIFGPGVVARAVIRAKEPGILAGTECVRLTFEALEAVTVHPLLGDGDPVDPGTEAFHLAGPVRSLLAGERTALNFLQRLSGIATRTRAFVHAVGDRVAICDTRKTTPLWRDIEKAAVRAGGGTNHRVGLFDMVMIKDTHVDGAGGLAEALGAVAHLRPLRRVAAEARTLAEVDAALASQSVDLLMLDNMSAGDLRLALQRVSGRIPVEITGGITEETVAGLAGLGVDRVSIGALTHSVRALDFSMVLLPP